MVEYLCERRKLGMNVGKSKVMRCSRMEMGVEHVILNGEPLEEMDCFKYMVVTSGS